MIWRSAAMALVALLFAAWGRAPVLAQAEDLSALDRQLVELVRAERYREATPIAERILALTERMHGPAHPNVASALNNLASLLRTQDRYVEAGALYERAQAIFERGLGSDDPRVADNLNSLGELYQLQKRYAEAEPIYKRALEITERALGRDHIQVALALNNLGDLYRLQARYSEAEPVYRRALAIGEKVLGLEHPQLAALLNNQGDLYRLQGRHSEAEPVYRRALAIGEKALGPDHPQLAVSLTKLGVLYRLEGRYAEAEPVYKRSLGIRERAFGPDHMQVAVALNNLGELYRAQERFGEAEPVYKRALAIGEKALGPEHPQLAGSLNDLGEVYRLEGRYADAAQLYRRAAAIAERPDIAQQIKPPGPYATVPVFFGTDRKQEKDRAKGDRQLAAFGNEGAGRLVFGQAFVTVPLSGRESGQVPRPGAGGLFTKAETEEATRHFTLINISLMNEEELIQAAANTLGGSKTFKGHAFVFVHGYNVSFDDALFRTAQIAFDLGFDGVPYVYSWPANRGIFGWKADLDRALAARHHLRTFLELVVRKSGATEFHLIAHSMGSWPLLDVLREIASNAETQRGLHINQIVLAAPDMDRANFEVVMRKIRPLAKDVTLYASSKDLAMLASGVLALGEDRVGYVPRNGIPVVVPGVETIDVSQVSLNFFSFNHTEFAEQRHLLHDLGLILRTGTHPPHERLPVIYDRVPSHGGIFWKYRR